MTNNQSRSITTNAGRENTMTKKLICPNCKTELEYIKEYAIEKRVYTWKINSLYDDADTFEDECYDSETQFFECYECGNHSGALEDFIVEYKPQKEND